MLVLPVLPRLSFPACLLLREVVLRDSHRSCWSFSCGAGYILNLAALSEGVPAGLLVRRPAGLCLTSCGAGLRIGKFEGFTIQDKKT